MFLTGRQVAWMTSDHFKISDTDGTFQDLPDLVKVELRSDNVQSFDTRWDETIIAMSKQFDEAVLENLYLRQLDKADRQWRDKLVSATASPKMKEPTRTSRTPVFF